MGWSAARPAGRRTGLVCGLLALVIAGDLACTATAAKHRPKRNGTRPNIVLIVTDDQRWDTLWAMPHVRSLLAASGVTFTNAFVTTSLCCPSRASIFTGQYSRHTGVWSDAPPLGGAPAFRDGSTVATWLHASGYTTALVGKYLNDYAMLGPRYIPPGWDEWDAIALNEAALHYYDFPLNQNGHLVFYGHAPKDYSTSVLAEHSVRFVQEATAPFFLYLAPIAPHLPAIPAPQDVGRFANQPLPASASFNETDVTDKPWSGRVPPIGPAERSALIQHWDLMLASLQSVDRAVASIVAAVASRGELDRTVFIFTSDNGLLLGEHRLSGKIWPYEESIRVPLVVRAPDVVGPGRSDPRIALNIDLASTIAGYAGARPGLHQDGRSLVPLLEERTAHWRRGFVVEFLQSEPLPAPPAFEAIRTERYLYVEYRTGWRELYDLRADPHELSNLARDPASRALRRTLARELHALLRS
jgi:N-acetylglucosamine-6-sulfatase